MTTRATPPKPHLVLRVGVTGHRLNKIPEDRRVGVRATIGQVLRCLGAAATGVHRSHLWAFDEQKPELRIVSALAEGTDTFAAEEGRAADYVLEAPLPLDPDDYKKDFELAASAGTLDRLRGDEARAVAIIGPDATEGGGTRDARYEAAGRLVLAQSDVLIAVWDGEPKAGRGGTQQMIDEARRRGILVVWLDPLAQAAPRLWLARGEEGGQWQDLPSLNPDGNCSAPTLGDEVTRLLAPPGASSGHGEGSHHAGPSARARLEQFYRERYRSKTLWCAYDGLRVFRGDWSGWSIRVPLGELDATEKATWEDFFRPITGQIGDRLERTLRDVLRKRFVHADNAALYFSHVYRSAYVINFMLAALAVMVGLSAVLAWDNLWVKFVSVVVELVLISLIVWITKRGNDGGWHQRWLDYRRLAELLRPARMMALLGRAPDVAQDDEFADEGTRWIAWYSRATLREIGLPAGTLDRSYLDRAAAAVLDGEIGRPAKDGRSATGQLGYHAGNQARLMRLEHGLEWFGNGTFMATALVAAMFVVLFLLAKFVHPPMEGALKALKPLFTLFGVGLPAVGASLAGIRAQADFRSFADRSRTTHGMLLPIAERLVDPARPKTLEGLEREFALATEAMMGDLRVWRLIYRNRELSLPA